MAGRFSDDFAANNEVLRFHIRVLSVAQKCFEDFSCHGLKGSTRIKNSGHNISGKLLGGHLLPGIIPDEA